MLFQPLTRAFRRTQWENLLSSSTPSHIGRTEEAAQELWQFNIVFDWFLCCAECSCTFILSVTAKHTKHCRGHRAARILVKSLCLFSSVGLEVDSGVQFGCKHLFKPKVESHAVETIWITLRARTFSEGLSEISQVKIKNTNKIEISIFLAKIRMPKWLDLKPLKNAIKGSKRMSPWCHV